MKNLFDVSLKNFTKVVFFCVCLAICGCDGTETRETVDDTVEEITGKKDLERYKQMKDSLGEIQEKQSEKYRQLDE